MSDSIVIVGAKRTPIGGMNGQFVSLSSPQLAAAAIKAAVAQSGVKPQDINEAIIGCVLPAAVARPRDGRRYWAQAYPRPFPVPPLIRYVVRE